MSRFENTSICSKIIITLSIIMIGCNQPEIAPTTGEQHSNQKNPEPSLSIVRPLKENDLAIMATGRRIKKPQGTKAPGGK